MKDFSFSRDKTISTRPELQKTYSGKAGSVILSLDRVMEKMEFAAKILKNIERIEATDYGDPALKRDKITALNSLVDMLLFDQGPQHEVIPRVIENWKAQHTAGREETNERLIAEHRRKGEHYGRFLGFFVEGYNYLCQNTTKALICEYGDKAEPEFRTIRIGNIEIKEEAAKISQLRL